MNSESRYRNTQRSILYVIVYATAAIILLLSWAFWNEPLMRWTSPCVGLLLVILGASFHHLTVEDERDHLSIRFGPIPIFRRSVRYEDITSVNVGRTTILDGWGIHRSLRGGWVWNLWGRDCVVLNLRRGVLRVGTDDAANLAEFVRGKLSHPEPTTIGQ